MNVIVLEVCFRFVVLLMIQYKYSILHEANTLYILILLRRALCESLCSKETLCLQLEYYRVYNLLD